MPLILEDGTGVIGANTYSDMQGAAAFFAGRGGLVPLQEFEIDGSAEFVAGTNELVVPAGTLADVTFPSIIQIQGASNPANQGFAFARSISEDGTTVKTSWLAMVNESPSGIVTLTVYDRTGWYADTSARLEAALTNGAEAMNTRYPWGGWPTFDVQELAWPRGGVVVDAGSPYYAEGYEVADDEIPLGVVRCHLWLALADLETPLREPVDPQSYLQSKSIGPGGIAKTFGGEVRRRRFPHADAEVAGLMSAEAIAAAGPFIPIQRV